MPKATAISWARDLLLVEPAELRDGACAIEGRRAVHVRDVLGAKPGDAIRAGAIGGGVGDATVTSDDGTTIVLALRVGEGAPRAMPVELVLAVPRPKVIARAVEIAASFAVQRIDLTNAWRVDKSYLTSPSSPMRRSRPARGSAPSKARRRTSPRSRCIAA